MAEAKAQPELTSEQVAATMRSREFAVLLVLVAIVGVVVSVAAWCFLESIYQLQRGLFTHLPETLGYDNGPPLWWPLPVLAIGGLLTALAITYLPGGGGHVPAYGLNMGAPTQPRELPGVIAAGLATISFGLVLGPEAPLIALGGAVALMVMGVVRRDAPPQALALVAAAGSFATLSFIFSSPLIAAVFLIEATAIGGPRMRLVLVPGLLAAGIGSLVSVGIGSFTGLSTSAYALPPLPVPDFGHPTLGQFGWTVALGIAVAVGTAAVIRGGRLTHAFASRRLLIVAPALGLVIAGLGIAFSEATDKSVNEVLFSGQDALPGLVAQESTWSLGALALLIAFKGAAYSLSLGAYRGGPTFPAIFLGAAAGVMASHLPGFPLTPAVGVGMGAAVVAVLRLPLSAVVLATLLTSHAGTGDEPLIIVGVVVSYVVTLVISAPHPAQGDSPPQPATESGRTP